MYLSIGEASRMIGVSISTLRRWHKILKLVPQFYTSGGHRRYSLTDIQELIGMKVKSSNKMVIGYCRVSSHDQKQDLIRQKERLDLFCKKEKKSYELIDDLGSGLNFKKKGLKRLITLILKGQVSKIVLTHKDRLLRFGNEIVFMICNFFGVAIEFLEEKKLKSKEETLAYDVLEIITVFSARLYGSRSHKNKKAIAITKGPLLNASCT